MDIDNSKSNLGITATYRMSAYLIQSRTDDSQATFTMTHNQAIIIPSRIANTVAIHVRHGRPVLATH